MVLMYLGRGTRSVISLIYPKYFMSFLYSFYQVCLGNKMFLLIRCELFLHYDIWTNISKFGDLSRGWLEGSLFNSYHTEV